MMDTVVFGKTETGKGRGHSQTNRVRDGRYPCGTSSSTSIIINACWQALQTSRSALVHRIRSLLRPNRSSFSIIIFSSLLDCMHACSPTFRPVCNLRFVDHSLSHRGFFDCLLGQQNHAFVATGIPTAFGKSLSTGHLPAFFTASHRALIDPWIGPQTTGALITKNTCRIQSNPCRHEFAFPKW
jgi:hypothetical protein